MSSDIQAAYPIGSLVRVSDVSLATWMHGVEGTVTDHWEDMVGVRLGKRQSVHYFANIYSLELVEPEPTPPGGDVVSLPTHYRSHPSGVECIDIVAHMGFCLGAAIKYLWRADLKHDDGGVTDLRKAVQFIEFEIARREGNKPSDGIRVRVA